MIKCIHFKSIFFYEKRKNKRDICRKNKKKLQVFRVFFSPARESNVLRWLVFVPGGPLSPAKHPCRKYAETSVVQECLVGVTENSRDARFVTRFANRSTFVLYDD